MREASNLGAALALLAPDAPPGFATRLERRYLLEIAARRRRHGLIIAGLGLLVLAAMGAATIWFLDAPSLFSSTAGLGVALSAVCRAALHGLAEGLTQVVAGLAVFGALAACCSVALAALVRREALAQ